MIHLLGLTAHPPQSYRQQRGRQCVGVAAVHTIESQLGVKHTIEDQPSVQHTTKGHPGVQHTSWVCRGSHSATLTRRKPGL